MQVLRHAKNEENACLRPATMQKGDWRGPFWCDAAEAVPSSCNPVDRTDSLFDIDQTNYGSAP
jgi:hypothetical protein